MCVTQYQPTPDHPYPFDLGFRIPKVEQLAIRSLPTKPLLLIFCYKVPVSIPGAAGAHLRMAEHNEELPLSVVYSLFASLTCCHKVLVSIRGAAGAHLRMAEYNEKLPLSVV